MTANQKKKKNQIRCIRAHECDCVHGGNRENIAVRKQMVNIGLLVGPSNLTCTVPSFKRECRRRELDI